MPTSEQCTLTISDITTVGRGDITRHQRRLVSSNLSSLGEACEDADTISIDMPFDSIKKKRSFTKLISKPREENSDFDGLIETSAFST